MPDIITNPDGSINWHANGWPEPNPWMIYDEDETEDGVNADNMPDDIFEVWLSECRSVEIYGAIDE